MELKNQNILFFTRSMGQGGTENVILQLCEILKLKVNNIVVCSCGGVNVQRLNDIGIKHYTIPDITIKKPSKIMSIIVTLKKIIKIENITVIHSHHRMAAFYTKIVSSKNIIQIVNAHNTFYDKKILTQIAYKNANIVAVGEQVKKNLEEYYKIPSEQISVIHNGIKPFTQNVIPDVRLVKAKNDGCTLVGNIGRLSEQKGMEYFIKAAAMVNKKEKKVKFFIIGDGEDAAILKKMSAELLPDGVLTFMGYRNDIQNIMSQLDFIVLSSLWEGLPLTPIEAFSVGKTVIATNVDGTPEIVRNNNNGLLVKVKDINELANAILKLNNDNLLLERLSNNAYITFKDKFTIEKMKNKYIEFYKSIGKNYD